MRSVVTVVVVLAIMGGAVALVYGLAAQRGTVKQPIAFNHALHLDEAGVQCIECHTGAETGVYAGLPGKNSCFDCHDIDEEDDSPPANPEKARLFAFDDRPDEIPWVRVAVTKPDVFFSHRRHVACAQMDCLECHPDQPKLTAPPSIARQVMTMDDCIDCHTEKGASIDCLACHR
jgi:hypothetical protein